MMHPRGGLCFTAKSFLEYGSRSDGPRKQLQCDVPAQRFLHRFIDDSHPSAAQLAHDAIVADLPRRGGWQQPRSARLVSQGTRCRASFFHNFQGWEQRANILGEFGIPRHVLVDRRPIAASPALHK
jgi:hypothetical protein